jgi:hypothetical protein
MKSLCALFGLSVQNGHEFPGECKNEAKLSTPKMYVAWA